VPEYTAIGDVHPMDATAIEALHTLTRTEPAEQERCDCSYFRRWSMQIKLELTVNTDDEKLAGASALRRNHR